MEYRPDEREVGGRRQVRLPIVYTKGSTQWIRREVLRLGREQRAVGGHAAEIVPWLVKLHPQGIGQSRAGQNCCDGEEKKNNSTTTAILHPAGALYKDNFTLVLSNSAAKVSSRKLCGFRSASNRKVKEVALGSRNEDFVALGEPLKRRSQSELR